VDDSQKALSSEDREARSLSQQSRRFVDTLS
jgi:hypothetical protein